MAVGIGDQIDQDFLEKTAGQKGRAISVSDFNELQGRLKEIRDVICRE